MHKKINYPKNIQEWFSDGRDNKFALWAFGCEQPGSNQKMLECWERLHPEYPMIEGDNLFLCICKMNYIYQHRQENP